jgi:2,3-bisphosphoglycerate-dependent phosphoglycerate mutase
MSVPMSTRLVAIRHGETAWNRDTRIQGHTDIPLSEHGHWQAKHMALALQGEGIDAIYTSDLIRASQTAQALAEVLNVPLLAEVGLRERHFGRFEGLTHDEIMASHPHEGRRWRQREPSYGPEGGEVLQAFYDRVVGTADALAAAHKGQTIAMVAHGGVLDCLYRAATHVGLETPRTWQIGNASINRLLWADGDFSLVGWGDTRHLDAPTLDEVNEAAIKR